jgi:ribosomal protein S18 acetylase RimI-like enzyme
MFIYISYISILGLGLAPQSSQCYYSLHAKKAITRQRWYMQEGNHKDVTIRPAGKEDAPFLAHMILMAGRAHVKKGIWEVVLGNAEPECVAFLQTLATSTVPHLFHYSCHLIAEIDDKPVASLGGYNPQVTGYHALRKAIAEVITRLELPPEAGNAAGKRSKKMLACLPQEVKGAWVIDSVATLPKFRRYGIAGTLLDAILEQGRCRGFHTAQINLYIGNIPALRIYTKHGFKVREEKQDHYFAQEIGSPGMLSMVRKL